MTLRSEDMERRIGDLGVRAERDSCERVLAENGFEMLAQTGDGVYSVRIWVGPGLVCSITWFPTRLWVSLRTRHGRERAGSLDANAEWLAASLP